MACISDGRHPGSTDAVVGIGEGSPVGTRQNLAARAGRWSAGHWKTATLLWLAFVIVAVVIGQAVGTHKLSDSEQGTGETARAQAILSKAGFKTPASESVLVQSKTLRADSPAFRAVVADVAAVLRAKPQITNLRVNGQGQVSKDGHSQLVQFDMKGKIEDAHNHVQPLLDAVDKVQAAHTNFTVAEFGFASATKELHDTMGKDFQKAEKLTVPITFLILLFAFDPSVAGRRPRDL